MTLDSRIYVHGETGIPNLFIACQRAVLRYDQAGRTLDQIVWEDEEATDWSREARERTGDGYVPNGKRDRLNTVGQGLPAWLWLHYRLDGPYRSVEESQEHDECCEYEDSEPCDGSGHRPAAFIEIMLDTTYGYEDERGWGCGDLHAALIWEIGHYLDAQGVGWSWMNEFTGEIHDGFNNLDDLGGGGAKAQNWFRNTVLPAIAAGILSGEL